MFYCVHLRGFLFSFVFFLLGCHSVVTRAGICTDVGKDEVENLTFLVFDVFTFFIDPSPFYI